MLELPSSLLCGTDFIHWPFMGQKPPGLRFMVVAREREKKNTKLAKGKT